MSRLAWILVTLVGVALFAVLLASRPRDSAAGSGQTVMVYTPFPVSIADAWVKPFEEQTGIRVIQIKEGTTRVYSRLRAEQSYPRADVWIGGGGMIPFITAANQGMLEPYKPRGWENMPVKRGNLILRDAQWRWVGATVIALGFAYNPTRTRPEDLPKKWTDLADPKWHNQIMMWDPASSGTAMLFLEAALQRSIRDTGSEQAGWQFLRAFYANLQRYSESPPSMYVERGEVAIGIHFEHQVLEYLQQIDDPRVIAEKQRNLRWTVLPDSPVIVDPIALIKNGPHPENGKKFIDFIMSHPGQGILNRLCFVQDPSYGPPRYLDYTRDQLLADAMPLDVDWMANNFNLVVARWENDIETSKWLWESTE
jgi:iron(III) transport system substrate-binding protein